MGSQQLYSLSWGEFGTSLTSTVQVLRGHGDMVDVTLAAGGRIFPAHKLVLSAASPLLMELLKSTHCHHPVLMLAGITAPDLEALLQFVYQGEVSVDPSQLPSLLQAAHCLDIQALSPQTITTEKTMAHVPVPVIMNDNLRDMNPPTMQQMSRDMNTTTMQAMPRDMNATTMPPMSRDMNATTMPPMSRDMNATAMQPISRDINAPPMPAMLRDMNVPTMQPMIRDMNAPPMPAMSREMSVPTMRDMSTSTLAPMPREMTSPMSREMNSPLMSREMNSPLLPVRKRKRKQQRAETEGVKWVMPEGVVVERPMEHVDHNLPPNPCDDHIKDDIMDEQHCNGEPSPPLDGKLRCASEQPCVCPLCGVLIRQARNLRRHLLVACASQLTPEQAQYLECSVTEDCSLGPPDNSPATSTAQETNTT